MKSIKLPETTEAKLLFALIKLLHMVDDSINETKNLDKRDVRYEHAIDVMFDAQDEFVLRARKEGLVQDTPSKDGINLANITREEFEIVATKLYLKVTEKTGPRV